MVSLTETLLLQATRGNMPLPSTVSKFTATEIRQTIADLVARDQLVLANALSDAGMSLYPQSEEILSIAALLAEIQSDWVYAEQLLEHLIEVQAQVATPHAWRHLIRVQRCHWEPAKALLSAQQAVHHHPDDADLAKELADIQELLVQQTVFASPSRAQ